MTLKTRLARILILNSMALSHLMNLSNRSLLILLNTVERCISIFTVQFPVVLFSRKNGKVSQCFPVHFQRQCIKKVFIGFTLIQKRYDCSTFTTTTRVLFAVEYVYSGYREVNGGAFVKVCIFRKICLIVLRCNYFNCSLEIFCSTLHVIYHILFHFRTIP